MNTISSTEAIHQITLDKEFNPRIPPRGKQARPNYKWAERALIECWEDIRKSLTTDKNTDSDPTNQDMR